jgi:hypothetical protein
VNASIHFSLSCSEVAKRRRPRLPYFNELNRENRRSAAFCAFPERLKKVLKSAWICSKSYSKSVIQSANLALNFCTKMAHWISAEVGLRPEMMG